MENEKSKGRKIPAGARKGFRIVSLIMVVAAIAVCIPLVAPRLMGYQLYNVLSGSMEPQIHVGSIVCAAPTDPNQIDAGDVIVFYGGHDRSTVVTHRVVENDRTMRQFVTKGDANAVEDPQPVSYLDLIGKVRLVIPLLGKLSAAAPGGSVRFYLILFLAAAFLFGYLGRKDSAQS